ncbi:MAG TPA: hypothetical protein VD993_11085 [Chitinophagaceae bacterium]|nr:hypothetical protein [Chitinophagaceae bacterium]
MAIADFFNLTVCAEIAALIAALLFITRQRHGYWRLFPLYLAVILLAEWIGFSLRMQRIRNHHLYNILWIFQSIFFSYLFYRFHQVKYIKYQVFFVLGIFLCFYLSEAFYRSFSDSFQFSRQFLSIIIIFFSCTFYFSLLKHDITSTPLRFPPFWIVTGLFFFYFGSAIMFTIPMEIKRTRVIGNMILYDLVMGTFSCILYGSWVTAFIWKNRQIQ